MEIKKLDYIDETISAAFNDFLGKCSDYEPYYSNQYNPKFLGYAFFEGDTIISYLGALLINFEKPVTSDLELDEASKNIFEISALTLPEYRNKGCFTKLLGKCISDWQNSSNFIMPLEDEFKDANFVSDYLYSEYLYVLKKEDFVTNQEALSKDSLKIDHYCAFTEDHQHYYLYLSAEDASNSGEALEADESSESSAVYGIKDEDVQILNACFNEEEPAAVINISFEKSYATIYGVFVDEDKRNLGLGYALLYDCLEEHFSNYDLPLILNVTSTNIPACKLYKKAGFKAASQVNFYAITSPIS